MSGIAEQILAKAVLPTDLDAAGYRAKYSAQILRRSFVSAEVAEARTLEALRQAAADYGEGNINEAEARARMLKFLGEAGYDPEGKTGLKDLSSRRRLDLVFDTQKKMAGSVALLSTQTSGQLKRYPAWRLARAGSRRHERTDWAQRWAAAGESAGWEGAAKDEMVALKDSPIWQALGDGAGGYRDTLGNPYPPFAFGSGMDWWRVSAADAAALGLDVGADKAGAKTEQAAAELAPSEDELAEDFAVLGGMAIALKELLK